MSAITYSEYKPYTDESLQSELPGGITCKNFEKYIPDFLEDRLDNHDLDVFLEHMESCKNCQDELSIQYLVKAGIQKLEAGETFHLQRELDDYIENETGLLRKRKNLSIAALGFECLAICTFAATMILLGVLL